MNLPPLNWLWTQHVPLWAFLVALLTAPAKWTDWILTNARERFGGETA